MSTCGTGYDKHHAETCPYGAQCDYMTPEAKAQRDREWEWAQRGDTAGSSFYKRVERTQP